MGSSDQRPRVLGRVLHPPGCHSPCWHLWPRLVAAQLAIRSWSGHLLAALAVKPGRTLHPACKPRGGLPALTTTLPHRSRLLGSSTRIHSVSRSDPRLCCVGASRVPTRDLVRVALCTAVGRTLLHVWAESGEGHRDPAFLIHNFSVSPTSPGPQKEWTPP